MPFPLRRRTALTTSLAAVLGLGAAACGPSPAADGPGDDSPGDEVGAAAGFPLVLSNCEAELTLPAPPARVVLLESSAVTLLEGIGVLDRVVARAGSYPGDHFDADLAARVAAIPALSADLDATGHLQINLEVVIAQRPDLVIGLPDGITREGLRAAGAEALVANVFCGNLTGRASFETLFAEITTYGAIFDRVAEAEELIETLQQRIQAAGAPAEATGGATGPDAEEWPVRSVAVLYPSVGGGPLYTYGAQSMATAQLDVLGIQNAFADTEERVFEVSAEPLLAADPDLLIVLHEGDVPAEDAVAEVLGRSRLAALRAVQHEAVLPLLFHHVEPASPLVVDGLEQIRGWVAERSGTA